eukprot:Gb_28442 [translate_table: standard]
MGDGDHELRRVYERMDENRDGRVSLEEIRGFLAKLGIEMSEEELECAVSRGRDRDGGLTFEEFVRLYESIMMETKEEDLLEAFRMFDKNEDGFISPSELHQMLSALGFTHAQHLADCHNMISAFDSDSNGLIDFHEFKTMIDSQTLQFTK